MSDDELRNLDELAALPLDDPRVRGLDARTSARLRAYREFLAPDDASAGASLAEAEDRLLQVIDREIGVAPSPTEHRARAEAPAGAMSDRGETQKGELRDLGAFLRGLFAPAMRLGLTAVLLLVAAGGAWWFTARREAAETVMRGPSVNAPGLGAAAETRATPLAGGVLRLEWAPLAEADRYTVVFLSPDLTELTRVADLAEPRLDLRPGALPAGLAPGRAVLWRVVGMRGTDEVARTRASSVTLP